jgi:hypothetical protein
MTNKEIIEKALQKALNNGWAGYSIGGRDTVINAGAVVANDKIEVSVVYTFPGDSSNYVDIIPAALLIFNHSFSEAFHGELFEVPLLNGIQGDISDTPEIIVNVTDPEGRHITHVQPNYIAQHEQDPLMKDAPHWHRTNGHINLSGNYKRDNVHIRFNQSAWRFHLQQMVMEKDPIKYLAQFV